MCAFNCVLQILTNKIDATPLSASAICCPQPAVALLLDITLQHQQMQQPLLVFPAAGLLVDQQELSFFFFLFGFGFLIILIILILIFLIVIVIL